MDTKVVLDLLAKIQPVVRDVIYPQQGAQAFLNHGLGPGTDIQAGYQTFTTAGISGRLYADSIVCQDLAFITRQAQMLVHVPKENAGTQKQVILELVTNYEDDWCGTSWPKRFPPKPKGLELAELTLEDRVNAAVRFYQASFVVKDHQIETALVDAAVRILEVATTAKELKETDRVLREKQAGVIMG